MCNRIASPLTMTRLLILQFVAALSVISIVASAQTRTISSSGNFGDPGIWVGGVVPTTLSEDIVMNNGTSINFINGQSFVLGNVSAANNNTITIEAGAMVQIGDAGNPRNITVGNNVAIIVSGTLIIYGNLDVQNNLTVDVTTGGVFTIHGDITMHNNAALDVSGDMTVDGNFTGGTNTNVNVDTDGVITVGGSVSMGNGSELTGDGDFIVAGGCTGPPEFCQSPALPIKLISFSVSFLGNSVVVDWVTEEEVGVSHYTIQRSAEDLEFVGIGDVAPASEKHQRHHYTFVDRNPLNGVSYYRLMESDLDGEVILFAIEKVSAVITTGFSLYPNPVTDGHLMIMVRPGLPIHYQIDVLDVTGRVLQRLNSSQSELNIPLEYAPGLYYIKFQSHDIIQFKQVLRR